ncbi:MAG: hypothetical protein HY308_15680 [Gammaproteobacteria bacterium]|nr:hypothetical protein [Gammaproteobacteria bacterium]
MSDSKNTDKSANNEAKKRYTLEELLKEKSRTNWAALISEERNMATQQRPKRR